MLNVERKQSKQTNWELMAHKDLPKFEIKNVEC